MPYNEHDAVSVLIVERWFSSGKNAGSCAKKSS